MRSVASDENSKYQGRKERIDPAHAMIASQRHVLKVARAKTPMLTIKMYANISMPESDLLNSNGSDPEDGSIANTLKRNGAEKPPKALIIARPFES